MGKNSRFEGNGIAAEEKRNKKGNSIMKPKIRSRLRLMLGRIYFTFKRYFQWYFSKIKFTKEIRDGRLDHAVFNHKSLLVRQLKNVDMYLQENKKTNLKIASGRLNGIILKPGETFSFWKLVGRPSKNKGYLEGLSLQNGELKKDTGGGLCQLANLIYWMTLHTPLNVVERWRHGYDVFPDAERTQPFGTGATVAYNYIDLQIYNPTEQYFQLILWLDDTYLLGEWRSDKVSPYAYKIIEKNHSIRQQDLAGYVRHNEIYREISGKNGEKIKTEFITENNAIMMYNPLLEGKKA